MPFLLRIIKAVDFFCLSDPAFRLPSVGTSVLGKGWMGPQDIHSIAAQIERDHGDLLPGATHWSGVEIAFWRSLGNVREDRSGDSSDTTKHLANSRTPLSFSAKRLRKRMTGPLRLAARASAR